MYLYTCIFNYVFISYYVGGYKGYGLAMMVEVFCGILAGANFGPNIRSWKSNTSAANLVGEFWVFLPVTTLNICLYPATTP